MLAIESELLMSAINRGEVFRDPSGWYTVINQYGSGILPYSHVMQIKEWEETGVVTIDADGTVMVTDCAVE